MLAIRSDPDAPVILGGRGFQVIDFDARTVLQDHYLQRLIQELSLDRVMPMDGEDDAAYLVRMQNALICSGRSHELIAGYLIPEGATNADWDQKMAASIARHIGGLNTVEDRERVQQLAMEAVFGFFQQGLEQLRRSLERLEPRIDQPEKARV